MAQPQRLYIAGIGMITSVGADTAMTAASVKAGVSGYQVSRFFNQKQQPVTMSCIPNEIFSAMDIDIDEGHSYSAQYDRIIKMAILALREAISEKEIEQPVPLVLAMPDEHDSGYYIPPELLMANLIKQKDLNLKSDSIRFSSTGRAAGIQALDLAIHYLFEQGESYVLLGGSDSYWNAARICHLDNSGRLLALNQMDAFVAGEGAGFILLTSQPERAMSHNNQILSLFQFGDGQEAGHLYSDKPYTGDGLDQAFKCALSGYTGEGVDTIYSSMNGENHWAKECGVAIMRNKKWIKDDMQIEHPSDCLGDLGVATGTVLIGLAAQNMLQASEPNTHLVYSSSDGAWRAAVRMEKLPKIVGV